MTKPPSEIFMDKWALVYELRMLLEKSGYPIAHRLDIVSLLMAWVIASTATDERHVCEGAALVKRMVQKYALVQFKELHKHK